MSLLSETGEDALIERLVRLVPTHQGAGGPGDDCAVVDTGGGRLILLKADGLVEGVHFLKTADSEAVGWKAVARVISDFAAMGGVAERFLVTLALPGAMELSWIEGVYRGMGKCMETYGANLVGGETCRVPDGSAAVLSIAATGSVGREKIVLRSGGMPGDCLWVTGRLGGSLAGKHLAFSPRVEEAQWIAERMAATAMMDVSDGLAKDLPRLAKASGCGFLLEMADVPLTQGCTLEQGLCDGEDFELLFAAPADAVAGGWEQRFPGLELTRIGRLVAAGEGQSLAGGWDHFS
ncbi:thiamine-monophosphate kinase [Akkermansiaceae bacterium]|nr:thiamine-monophosphate kinase [Akkermansiaceae bacterium]